MTKNLPKDLHERFTFYLVRDNTNSAPHCLIEHRTTSAIKNQPFSLFEFNDSSNRKRFQARVWRSQFPRHWIEFNSHVIGWKWKSTTTSLTNNGKYQYFISTNSTLNPGYHTLDKNSRNSRILSLFIKTKNSRNSRIPSLFIKSTNKLGFVLRSTIVLHLSGQKDFLSSPPPLKRRSIETLTSL